MELERIGKVIEDSLEHGNTKAKFTHEQIEVLTETIKAALEEYHKQTAK